jgi:catechol 2,3-dioxygenase-like lactoylglutathione lyase family enzyme
MSTTAIRSEDATTDARAGKVDMELEVVAIPVSDVGRAAEFYRRLGWRLDADIAKGDRVVSDIEAARDALIRNGVAASEVFHDAAGGYNRFDPDARASGPDPQRRSYASFVTFSDPAGNGWLLQEITTRFPGRVAGEELPQ